MNASSKSFHSAFQQVCISGRVGGDCRVAGKLRICSTNHGRA
jgi:hypothetical protein